MEQTIAALVQELLAALAPLLASVVVWVVVRVGDLARRWYINDVVARAIGRAAGAAFQTFLAGGRTSSPAAIDAAVQRGVDFVHAGPSVVSLLPKAGIDQDRLEQLVHAELGKLLAQSGLGVGGAPR